MTTVLVIVTLACLVAAATDLWKFRVPNALTFPLLFIGLIYRGIHDGLPGLGDAALGALLGFGCLVLFFLAGGMGAGDVKLMTAVGAWLGPWMTFHVFLYASIAAGVVAMIIGIATGRWLELWTRAYLESRRIIDLDFPKTDEPSAVAQTLKQPNRRTRALPFAALMAGAVVWVGVREGAGPRPGPPQAKPAVVEPPAVATEPGEVRETKGER